MGRVFGIIAKRKDEIVFKKIIYSLFSDANYFITELLPPGIGFSIPILAKSDFSDSNKEWFKFTTDEINALTYNHAFGSADETIRYTKSTNESFSPYFRAIKLKYDSNANELIYSNEHAEFENWSETKVLKTALYKMTTILYEQLKQKLLKSEDETTIKIALDNLLFMHNTIDVLSKIVEFDKIAIVSNED